MGQNQCLEMIRSKIDIARNYPREDTQDPNYDMLVTPEEWRETIVSGEENNLFVTLSVYLHTYVYGCHWVCIEIRDSLYESAL